MRRGGERADPLLPEEGWREALGWWEARLRRALPGVRPRTPVTFFAPPKKVTKERGIPGSPPLPRFLVRYPCAARPARRSAQLAHRLDSCRFIRR